MIDYKNREYDQITDIQDQKKIERLLSIIPDDVKNIIDIGCGNGLITNELNRYFKVLGVDINASKLKYVEGPSLQSSCDEIDRPDQSFDLVFSSEMIEHLEDDLLHAALKEMDRLSKKYILITVPNKEPLHKLQVKCEACGAIYHKNGHLHSFTLEKLDSLHPNWKVLEKIEYGRKMRNYKKSLATIKHKVAPPSAWIPKQWVKSQGVNQSFCTKCGHKNILAPKFHPLAFGIDALNTVTSPKFLSHLMVLFEKMN